MRGRFLVVFGVASLVVLLTTGVVLAQGDQLGGKLRTGDTITIPAGETVDHDLYAFGQAVDINGTIDGDLVVAAGRITVNGAVNGDVIAAGGQITISGPVTGDLRVFGGQLALSGDVTEDVMAAGGQVNVGGKVGEDLLVTAGDLTLSGSVAGSATGSVGTYSKPGSIAGSDDIRTAPAQAAPILPPRDPVFDAVRQFLAVLFVAALALWLMPRAFAAAEARVREQPLPSLGWGLVSMVGYVVAIVAIVVVMVLAAIVLAALGFYALLTLELLAGFVAFAGITLAFFLAAAFLADALVGLALARFVLARTGSATAAGPTTMRRPWADLGLLAVGAAVVVILTSLPVFGWVVGLVVAALGLGALWLAWRSGRVAAPA
jgi:hypothetical protein